MAALVAATRGVEFPRNINTNTTGIFVFAILGADIDTTVGCTLRVLRMQYVVGKDGNAETFILQELFAKTKVNEARGLGLTGTRLVVRQDASVHIQEPIVRQSKSVVTGV